MTNVRKVLICAAGIPLGAASLLLGQAASAECMSAEKRMAEIVNYVPTSDTLVLAHRGYWGRFNDDDHLTPENSLSAVVWANVNCVDGIEVDVKESGDGVLYLMHDFNLGRTTNVHTIRSGGKYDPMHNTGANPTVASLSALDIDRLQLLTPDRTAVTIHRVPRVSAVLQMWKNSHFTTPIIFDVKTTKSVQMLDQLAAGIIPGSLNTMGVKINATMYPDPAAFYRDARHLQPIPVFTTNMLGALGAHHSSVHDSLAKWQNAVRTIEVNVKQHGGLLSYQKDQVIRSGGRVGVFHALPDGPIANAFYKNYGECCYKLSDVYYTYIVNHQVAGRDTDDQRGNLDFLNSEGFGLITSDDPNGVVKYLTNKNKRRTHYQRYN